MGEDASNNEDKVGNSALQNPGLEVSVSFGKFENDSLSWEKFSSFSPNKYLEEVGKCATPGSVAQKKAYFEEHYKKIAARKSESLDQEKPMESKFFRSDNQDQDQDYGDIISKASGQCSVEEVKGEVNGICNGAANEEAATATMITSAVECPSSSAEGEREEKNRESETAKSCRLEESVQEEAVLVEERETLHSISQGKKELLQNSAEKNKETPKIKGKNVKLDHRSKSQKINTPVKKEKKVAEVKVKSASPGNRTLQSHTSRASKPIPTTSTVPSSRTTTKGGTISSVARTKTPSVHESKKVAPKSLHMSLSVEPSGSNAAPLSATRKSLIMERMGDKDIVKRAFKTFQSSYNELGSSSVDQSSTPKQPSIRTGGMEKKNAKAAPSIVGLRSDGKADKRNEFSKKLEGKTSARETERTGIQTKPKDNKEAEVKRLGQSPNFKATRMPRFYHGLNQSKSHLDKLRRKLRYAVKITDGHYTLRIKMATEKQQLPKRHGKHVNFRGLLDRLA